MISNDLFNAELDGLVTLGIVTYVDGNIKYTEEWLNMREGFMRDPKVAEMFHEEIEERGITDLKEQLKELLVFTSLLSLMKFGGGSMQESDIEVYMKYISTLDRLFIGDKLDGL